MAKKKKSIDLTDRNIEYRNNKENIKVICFNPVPMTVDINIHVEAQPKGYVLDVDFPNCQKVSNNW
jgi:hypothetical protein